MTKAIPSLDGPEATQLLSGLKVHRCPEEPMSRMGCIALEAAMRFRSLDPGYNAYV
jgi:hypothetical protein